MNNSLLFPIISASVLLLFLPLRMDARQLTPMAHSSLRYGRSTFVLIDERFARHEMSLDEWALYQAYALREPSKLPAQFRSDEPEKCGTWILDEILRKWSSLSAETKRELIRLGFSTQGTLSRPTGLDSTRGTTHFLVHYSLLPGDTNAVSIFDGNANGTPDYIDTVLTTIENVWNIEVGTMGYSAPPPDSGDGGDERYDVYVFSLGSPYGFAQAEKHIGDNPNSPSVTESNAYSSYLSLRNNYSGFPTTGSLSIEVTAAHEFYHAIQDGYDSFEDPWMKEATATWSEDEVYDNINDNYQYLGNWFARPHYPLDASNYTADTLSYGKGHWYGSWIFFRYISEHVGDPTTVRRILERVVDYDNQINYYAFNEIGDVLAEHNTSFHRVFRDFTTSNLVRTIYPYRYREGDAYPRVSRYLLPGDTTIASSQPRYSSYYFQVPVSLLPNCGKILTVMFTSEDPAAQLGADLISYKNGQVSEIAFQSSVTLSGTETPDSLFIVAMNFSASSITGNYTIKVQSRLREARYLLTDLGAIGNSSITGTINNSGRAVGTLVTSFGTFTSLDPVTWENGPAQYLGGTGYAFDINNNNDAIGWVRIPGDVHAHLWRSSGSGDLDTATFGYSVGWGVNDSGHAVGSANHFDDGSTGSTAQPTLWRDGVMRKLPLIPDTNAIGGVALDINNSDQIIGTVSTHQPGDPTTVGPTHTVLWNGGGAPIDISTTISLSRINDASQYVGYEYLTENVEGQDLSFPHTITGSGGGYSVAGISDGSPGGFVGRDINNADDVVGMAQTQLGLYAFVYAHGVMHNLNEMLGFGTCWSLTNATGINDSGQIIGTGYPASDPYNLHGYVLSPVSSPTSVSAPSPLPGHYTLYQNYPNPFNPTTTIQYDLPGQVYVQLRLVDLLGREVVSLVNEVQQPGHFSININASQLSSGIYFCRMVAGPFQDVKKLILLK